MTPRRLTASAGCIALVLAAVLLAGGCKQDNGGATWLGKRETAADFETAAGRPPTAKTLFALGKVLASQGRDQRAAVMFAQAIQQEPTLVAAYHELAEIYMRHNALVQAAEVLSAGLKSDPNDPVLLNNLGMCQLYGGDRQAALANFTKATAADPADARYRANLALALGMLGRYEECLALYGQMLKPGEAHYNLAVICDSRGDGARAAQEYAKAVAIDPKLKSKPVPKSVRNRVEAK